MARQVTAVGGDLYRVAMVELGDARQWWRLAQANSIKDPVLSGVTILTVPTPDRTLTDGLPPSGAANVNQ